MFEREQLREEFADLLRSSRSSVAGIERLLADLDAGDEALRTHLGELHEHAARHVSMLERLLEIVE